ncbi:uncharacterized protein [Periplaneta americana]|uniref:uncharacterized protein n=1 Tax=Periplaneta americana TaxID=6978 RepID=UPI0037E8A3BB
MKLNLEVVFNWIATIAMLLCFATSVTEVTAVSSDFSSSVTQLLDQDLKDRVRRQTHQRSRSLISLLSDYIAETRNDTMRAFNEIADLVTKQIVPVKEGIELRNTTEAPSGREASDNDTPTSTTPFTITQNEFFRILRRNLRGLARVFNMESRKAIEDSNNNVRMFRKQLMDVVRPYVAPNSTSS